MPATDAPNRVEKEELYTSVFTLKNSPVAQMIAAARTQHCFV